MLACQPATPTDYIIHWSWLDGAKLPKSVAELGMVPMLPKFVIRCFLCPQVLRYHTGSTIRGLKLLLHQNLLVLVLLVLQNLHSWILMKQILLQNLALFNFRWSRYCLKSSEFWFCTLWGSICFIGNWRVQYLLAVESASSTSESARFRSRICFIDIRECKLTWFLASSPVWASDNLFGLWWLPALP